MNDMNQFSDPNPIDVNALLGGNSESSNPSSFPAETTGEMLSNPLAPSVPQQPKPYLWFALWFLVCCSLGGLSAFGFLLLTALPPATDCQNISSISPDIERLHCAQEAARTGELPELLAGLELVETWSTDHPLYNEANRWMAEWSDSILQIARQRMAQNDMDGALELANRIPSSSPLYDQAQETIAQWQMQWQAGQGIYDQAQEALKQQDWDLAYAKIFDLREHPYSYWSNQQANKLSEQVLAEKQTRQLVAEAIAIAKPGQVRQLKVAFERLQPIDRSTHAWAEVQPLVTEWGEHLLAAGQQHWQEQRFQEALSLAELVKLSEELAPEAENLTKLSQARQLAIASGSGWKVDPLHLWRMMEAIAAAQQIPPESRLYTQAQMSLENWNAQLQDMRQLQAAQIVASLGNRDALEIAIDQAAQLDFDRPRRLQAQTLIAHWQMEAERLEDQPILLYAQRMADLGTVPALQTAIAQVNQIPHGRVLHGEAQGLAYEWSKEIEVLEDEPLLKIAQAQARQGLLAEAIQTASTIRPGRALYYKAQATIGDWQAQLNQSERRTRPPQATRPSSDRTDETPSRVAAEVEETHETNQVEWSERPAPISSPSPQPIAAPPPRLPRTIDELMQTHPRPAAERLPATRLQPTPASTAIPDDRQAPPTPAATETAPTLVLPTPTVEQMPALEWSPVPAPEAILEPGPNPAAPVEEEAPVSPTSPTSTDSHMPVLTFPREGFGNEANEATEEAPSSSSREAEQHEPAARLIEETSPLSQGWLEPEPFGLGSI